MPMLARLKWMSKLGIVNSEEWRKPKYAKSKRPKTWSGPEYLSLGHWRYILECHWWWDDMWTPTDPPNTWYPGKPSSKKERRPQGKQASSHNTCHCCGTGNNSQCYKGWDWDSCDKGRESDLDGMHMNSWYALLDQQPNAWIKWLGMPSWAANVAAPMRKLCLHNDPWMPAKDKILLSQSVSVMPDKGLLSWKRNRGPALFPLILR